MRGDARFCEATQDFASLQNNIMQNNHKPAPAIIIIFGGSGDLTKRKLIPAFYNLFLDKHMPDQFAVIGLGRTAYADDEFRALLREGIDSFSRRGKAQDEEWQQFAPTLSYLQSDINDEKSYKALTARIHALEKNWEQKPNLIFYLAIAPELVEPVATHLGNAGICKNIDRSRLVVEKPFGRDLETARKLNGVLTGIFDESQIYRIDHYLGKEAVQNMLVFRFANVLFEPIWNRKYIEHVQITASETVGVEDRGGYFDGAGTLRDMIQNHVLQLLCFVAMEPPNAFTSEDIRNRKVDVLRAIRRFEGKEIFEKAARGQYGGGWMQGEKVQGYREEPKVAKNSATDTFAALKFYIDNWRWQGVPFYVRSGKRMTEKMTVITVQFREVPHQVFPSSVAENIRPNRIIISITPDTGIRLRFQAKQVGLSMRLAPADLIFNYSQTYEAQPPEAYETLLHDVMSGDATLFMRSDEVEAAWSVVKPVMDLWEENPPTDFPNYQSGSWGPEAAERLIAADGYHWVMMPV